LTERELARGAAYRLAILRHAEEVSGNVAKTCRYYGIAPTVSTSGPAAIAKRASTALGEMDQDLALILGMGMALHLSEVTEVEQ